MGERFNYQTYLASREWSLLREEVRERASDTCEHCFHAPQEAVHHLTYERIGHEELRDLMAICNPCHEFVSGKSDVNPLLEWAVVSPPLEIPSDLNPRQVDAPVFVHLIVPVREETAPVLWPRCGQFHTCLFCAYASSWWITTLARRILVTSRAKRIVTHRLPTVKHLWAAAGKMEGPDYAL